MYGSDFPLSDLPWRSLGAADSFLWLYEKVAILCEFRIEPRCLSDNHIN